MSNTGPWRELLSRFWRNRLGKLGATGLLTLTVLSVGAPWLAPMNPNVTSIYNRLTPPGQKGYVLGSDEVGRDLASRIMHAGRVSLGVGLLAGTVVMLVGGVVGLLAGFYGGRIDLALMRLADVVLSFPTTFLLLAIAALLGTTTPLSIGLIIGATAWMGPSRIVRSEVLSLKEREFVMAATALGSPVWRILVTHLLPNVMAVLIVAGTLEVARAILIESTLSYLGFGVQPPEASWGNMLTNAQTSLARAPWLALLPGLAISIAVMSVNFVGDALRDALDPRLRI